MKAFLQKKGVNPSFHQYFITALSYMALGLFASLIIGTIIQTLGSEVPFLPDAFVQIGDFVTQPIIYGGAIGIAVAHGLKAPPLVLYSALFAGSYAADIGGGPAGSFIAALLAVELGKLVSKETKLDIVVTPFVTILVGFFVASFVGPPISAFLEGFGAIINWATDLRPFLMGMVVAGLMGLALTAPISSVAIAVMLDLQGLAAGAATVGCAAQMVGFAASSYRENGISGVVSQGIGTSMLQIANVVRKPIILLPPTVAGIVLAPVATVWLHLENNAIGAGMGTSGLVGPIMAFETMGFSIELLIILIMLLIVAPAIISVFISEALRKKGFIKDGDLKLDA
ncbi:PTS transporter subunit IIC [Alkalibacillus haloalkaliphilus]|uniref:PTS transporter subunit IIC n=1 Tax=Alkalibacillus haloalkaliphilus TaxID=94136 RepID=UPI002936C68F|nr:PTS sugar transporter subunit IIC [Alkalibacillus haloalkaliphilus]MDV2581258.1 PTS sugar transporter subunit IIC [Alkalibacillus haloalkaliphilus]